MKSLKVSNAKRNSLFGGWVFAVASLGVTAGLIFTPMPTQAAPAVSAERVTAKVMKEKSTAVAVKDVEETGSIEADALDDSTCSRSRKRLFVEGEGWIVRRVTTCY